MHDPEQWEYVGKCIECCTDLYVLDGSLKPSCPVEEGHLCYLEVEEEDTS